MEGSAENFRFFSYNLLAPVYLENHVENTDFYDHCIPAAVDWTTRRRLLSETIQRQSADVICFQEVQFERCDDGTYTVPQWLREALPTHDWDWTRHSAAHSKKLEERNLSSLGKQNVTIGLATAFRRDRFVFDIAESIFGTRRLITVLDSQQNGGNCFVIANVHLEGDPDAVEVRNKQLSGTVKRMSAVGHLVLMGDWNTAYARVDKRILKSRGLRRLSTGTSWYTGGNMWAIDHICIGPTLKCLETINNFTDYDREHALPNIRSPSDHTPVGATVIIVGQPEPPSPPPVEPVLPVISDERSKEIEEMCRALCYNAPPKQKGKPSETELVELRVFATAKNALLEGLANDVERRMAKIYVRQAL